MSGNRSSIEKKKDNMRGLGLVGVEKREGRRKKKRRKRRKMKRNKGLSDMGKCDRLLPKER